MTIEEQRQLLRLRFNDATLLGCARDFGLPGDVGNVDAAITALLNELSYGPALIALKEHELHANAKKFEDDISQLKTFQTQFKLALAIIAALGLSGLGYIYWWQSNLNHAAEEARGAAAEVRRDAEKLMQMLHETRERSAKALENDRAERQRNDEEHARIVKQIAEDERHLAAARARLRIVVLLAEADSIIVPLEGEIAVDPVRVRRAVQLARSMMNTELTKDAEGTTPRNVLESLTRLFDVIEDMTRMKSTTDQQQLLALIDRLEPNAAQYARLRTDFADYDKFIISNQPNEKFSDRATAYFRYALAAAISERDRLSGESSNEFLEKAEAEYKAAAGESVSLRWLSLVGAGAKAYYLADRESTDEKKVAYFRKTRNYWKQAKPYGAASEAKKWRLDNNFVNLDCKEALLIKDDAERKRLLRSAWETIDKVRKLNLKIREVTSTWAEVYCLLVEHDCVPNLAPDEKGRNTQLAAIRSEILAAIAEAAEQDLYRRRYSTVEGLLNGTPAFRVLVEGDKFPFPTDKVKQDEQKKVEALLQSIIAPAAK